MRPMKIRTRIGLGGRVYATEEEAETAARIAEESAWNREIDHERYYAYYDISCGWIVLPRPHIPGTCT